MGFEDRAEPFDCSHLAVDDSPRQTIVGDAVAEHAAAIGEGLEDRHRVAHEAQVLGAAEAGGSTADDGNLSSIAATSLARFLTQLLHVP